MVVSRVKCLFTYLYRIDRKNIQTQPMIGIHTIPKGNKLLILHILDEPVPVTPVAPGLPGSVGRTLLGQVRDGVSPLNKRIASLLAKGVII